jgi:hypothetical protein
MKLDSIFLSDRETLNVFEQFVFSGDDFWDSASFHLVDTDSKEVEDYVENPPNDGWYIESLEALDKFLNEHKADGWWTLEVYEQKGRDFVGLIAFKDWCG